MNILKKIIALKNSSPARQMPSPDLTTSSDGSVKHAALSRSLSFASYMDANGGFQLKENKGLPKSIQKAMGVHTTSPSTFMRLWNDAFAFLDTIHKHGPAVKVAYMVASDMVQRYGTKIASRGLAPIDVQANMGHYFEKFKKKTGESQTGVPNLEGHSRNTGAATDPDAKLGESESASEPNAEPDLAVDQKALNWAVFHDRDMLSQYVQASESHSFMVGFSANGGSPSLINALAYLNNVQVTIYAFEDASEKASPGCQGAGEKVLKQIYTASGRTKDAKPYRLLYEEKSQHYFRLIPKDPALRQPHDTELPPSSSEEGSTTSKAYAKHSASNGSKTRSSDASPSAPSSLGKTSSSDSSSHASKAPPIKSETTHASLRSDAIIDGIAYKTFPLPQSGKNTCFFDAVSLNREMALWQIQQMVVPDLFQHVFKCIDVPERTAALSAPEGVRLAVETFRNGLSLDPFLEGGMNNSDLLSVLKKLDGRLSAGTFKDSIWTPIKKAIKTLEKIVREVNNDKKTLINVYKKYVLDSNESQEFLKAKNKLVANKSKKIAEKKKTLKTASAKTIESLLNNIIKSLGLNFLGSRTIDINAILTNLQAFYSNHFTLHTSNSSVNYNLLFYDDINLEFYVENSKRPNFLPCKDELLKNLGQTPGIKGTDRRHVTAWHVILNTLNYWIKNHMPAGLISPFDCLGLSWAIMDKVNPKIHTLLTTPSSNDADNTRVAYDDETKEWLATLMVANSCPYNLWVGNGNVNSGINSIASSIRGNDFSEKFISTADTNYDNQKINGTPIRNWWKTNVVQKTNHTQKKKNAMTCLLHIENDRLPADGELAAYKSRYNATASKYRRPSLDSIDFSFTGIEPDIADFKGKIFKTADRKNSAQMKFNKHISMVKTLNGPAKFTAGSTFLRSKIVYNYIKNNCKGKIQDPTALPYETITENDLINFFAYLVDWVHDYP